MAPRKTKAKPKASPSPEVERVMRVRAAARERAVMAHHASMAMARDVQVTLTVEGQAPVVGWIVAMTNDHKPEATDLVGPSNLLLHVAEKQPPVGVAVTGAIVKAARKVPLERVGGLASVPASQ